MGRRDPFVNKTSKLRTTIRVSNREGFLSQCYNSLAFPGSVFLTKFAVILGASPFQFSILFAIAQCSQVFQPAGVLITRKLRSRKGIIIKLFGAGRLLTVLFGLLPFIFPHGFSIWLFLLLVFISASLQAVGMNGWIAWISDIVPLRMRGRFFSVRSRIFLLSGLVTGYVFGLFIDMFDPESEWFVKPLQHAARRMEFFSPQNLPYSFLFIFLIAGLLGLFALRIMSRQPEMPKEIEHEGIIQLLALPLKDRNFRKLLLFGLWWMLSIGIGSPFWQPFMIKKLGMTVVDIQIYGTVSILSSIVALRFWGSLIDRLGNKTAMRFVIVLGGLNPLVWVFVGRSNYFIVYFEAVTSGIMWAGAGLIATNFVLSVAPEAKRGIYSGMFAACSGVGMMCTMLISGAFLPPAISIFGRALEPEQVLFGMTGVLRWTTHIPLTWVDEPRVLSVRTLFSMYLTSAKVRLAQFVPWLVRKRDQDFY